MRTRLASALVALTAAAGIAAGVAGPVYAALGGSAASPTTSVEAARITSAPAPDPAPAPSTGTSTKPPKATTFARIT